MNNSFTSYHNKAISATSAEKITPTQHRKRTRHKFLLTFFPGDSNYAETEINGYILVKYFSNASHKWEVAIYTKDSFKKVQKYKERYLHSQHTELFDKV